jgi:hypothetical protein
MPPQTPQTSIKTIPNEFCNFIQDHIDRIKELARIAQQITLSPSNCLPPCTKWEEGKREDSGARFS